MSPCTFYHQGYPILTAGPRSKRRFSLNISPAKKASNRVMAERQEKRGSVDSNISDNHEWSAVQAERMMVDPAARWTTANRVG